jgi:hypothetical protein
MDSGQGRRQGLGPGKGKLELFDPAWLHRPFGACGGQRNQSAICSFELLICFERKWLVKAGTIFTLEGIVSDFLFLV